MVGGLTRARTAVRADRLALVVWEHAGHLVRTQSCFPTSPKRGDAQQRISPPAPRRRARSAATASRAAAQASSGLRGPRLTLTLKIAGTIRRMPPIAQALPQRKRRHSRRALATVRTMRRTFGTSWGNIWSTRVEERRCGSVA